MNKTTTTAAALVCAALAIQGCQSPGQNTLAGAGLGALGGAALAAKRPSSALRSAFVARVCSRGIDLQGTRAKNGLAPQTSPDVSRTSWVEGSERPARRLEPASVPGVRRHA